MADYEQYYRNLNPEQRLAVDNIDGPVMLVAGPGSGKTQVLSLRIANIIKNHPDMASNILALTYTDAATVNLKERLSALVGQASSQVTITTFHGFCNELIASRPDIFLTARQMAQIDELDKFTLIRDISSELGLKELRHIHDPDLYTKDILAAISNLKREAIGPADYKEKVAQAREQFEQNAQYDKTGKLRAKWASEQKQILKNAEFSNIYELYAQRLASEGLYDYDDMINFVLDALRNQPEFLADIQERYQYILVDEYQDTNGAQNQVVLTICSYDEPNIFVVGDEDQSIYSFQGANLENMLEFKQRFPSCIVISTKINYRSTQPILNAAKSLISHSSQRIEGVDKDLISARQEANAVKPTILKFQTDEGEYSYVLSQIKDILARGESPESIAVIYRTHKDILPLVAKLNYEDIEYKTESGNNILELPSIIRFVNTLRWLTASAADQNTENLDLLTLLALIGEDIPDLAFYQLVRASRTNNLAGLLSNVEELKSLGIEDADTLNKNFQLMLDKFRQGWSMPATELLGELVLSPGVLSKPGENLHQSSADTKAFMRLISFCKSRDTLAGKLYTLADLLSDLESMRVSDLSLKTGSSEGGVHLVTAHSAKGREYKYVFIIKAIDKNWGNKQNSSKFKLLEIASDRDAATRKALKLEEELRLFYVALTRAKDFLSISYSESYTEADRSRSASPSQFISMIDPATLAKVEQGSIATREENTVENIKDQINTSLASQRFSSPDLASYLRKLVSETELSFTSLQNYLDCPHRFLYLNLLRLPTPKLTPMILGSSIHKALESFAQGKKAGKLPSIEELQAVAVNYLERESIGQTEKDSLIASACEHIVNYYPQLMEWESGRESKQIIATEFNFRSISMPGVDSLLTGKIDLIEKDADGNFNLVDYKTGKPQSRNVITGVRKSDKEIHYLEQLTFYSLLCELDPHKRFPRVTATIRFTSPNTSGRFKEEVFEITGEQKLELREQIVSAAKEIHNLNFERQCRQPECMVCNRFS